MDDLAKCVQEWVESPKGQESLRATAAAVHEIQAEYARHQQETMLLWHEIKDKPMTI